MKRVLYQSLFLVLLLSAILTLGCGIIDYGNDLDNIQAQSTATTLFGNVTAATAALNASVLGQGEGSQPVAGAEIWIEDLPFFPHVFTNASGAYIFTNVPAGNHRVVASFTSTISKTPLKTRTSGSVVVSAQPNQAPGMTLETATNIVTGVLRDATGQTLPAGTQIVIWGEIVTVGAGGVFTSPPLPGSETQSELSVLTTTSANQPAATTPASSTLTVPLVPQGTPVQIDLTVSSGAGTSTGTTVIANRPAIVSLVTRKGGLATNTIEVGGQLSLTASAIDPDSDDQGKTMAVAWSLVGDGALTAGQNNSLVATFTAPWKSGTPSVSVMVTDPRGATTTVTLKLAVVGTVAIGNPDIALTESKTVKGGAAVAISSSGDANNKFWLAPAGTTNFVESATMTMAGGTATSINAPTTEGIYKLFVVNAAGAVSNPSTATVTVDNTAPTSQDTVLATSATKKSSEAVTIVSSGDTGNTVWLAPAGTTTFVEGSTMTKAGGTATSINAPTTEGSYKLFIVDAAGNLSNASTATVTVRNVTIPTNQDAILTASVVKKGGAAVAITSSGDADNSVWLAPAGTTNFVEGATMTRAGGTATSINTPSTEGNYKLFVVSSTGGVSAASTATVTVDNTAPTSQDAIFATSVTKKGGAAVTIASSGDADNTVWLAPAGTTNFVEGTTITKAVGNATSIKAPATEGAYKLFVVDASGNVSSASNATVTVDNTASTYQNVVLATSVEKKGGAAVTIASSGDSDNTVWLAPAGTTTFVEGTTMTKASGNATSINAPASEGAYKLFIIDAAGNVSNASNSTVTVDNTASIYQDAIFATSVAKKGGAAVTIASSGDFDNTVWLAPAGTTTFVEGTTMTKARGNATSINAPTAEGTYKLFIIDAAGNVSNASNATVTVDNTVPAASLQTPAANSLGTSITADLSLTFPEAMRVGTGNIVIRLAADSSVFQTIDVTDANAVTINEKVVSIKHSIFGFETKYYVTIANTCFTDAAGNAFAGYSQATDWSFTSQPGYSISATMVPAGVATAPRAIAIDTTNNWLYLADTSSNYLHKFDLEGNKLGSVGGTGAGDSQFNVINDVAVDSTGKIYVADKSNNKIKVFNSDLTFVAAISQQTPRRLSVGSGFLYVTTDRIGSPFKIQKRKLYADDPALTVMAEFSASMNSLPSLGQIADIEDIAVAPDGNIYVLDKTSDSMPEGFGIITIFDSGLTAATSRITGFTVPRGIEFNDGYMYIAEANESSSGKSQVKRCQLNGTVVETYTDQMSLPGAIVFDSNSNMYVPSVNGTKKILKLQKNF